MSKVPLYPARMQAESKSGTSYFVSFDSNGFYFTNALILLVKTNLFHKCFDMTSKKGLLEFVSSERKKITFPG